MNFLGAGGDENLLIIWPKQAIANKSEKKIIASGPSMAQVKTPKISPILPSVVWHLVIQFKKIYSLMVKLLSGHRKMHVSGP